MKKGGEEASTVTHRPQNSRKVEQCGLSVNWPCGSKRPSTHPAFFILDVSALRRDYRDSITQLSNTAVHRKNVDNDMLAESCYICLLRGWEIGEEVTTIRCECASWAHEACLAKSVFKTGGCPTCKRSIFLIDDKIVLARAVADGDTGKVWLLLENGIQHSTRDVFDTTPLLQAARGGEERRGEEYRRDMGVAFTALGGPRLVRYLGLNLMFVPGCGHGCCQPSLPSLIECPSHAIGVG
jgi:hypothetical protein